MVIGIILASLAGVIVPYLPTASDDINNITADMNSGVVVEEVVDTGVQIAPNSILNQFQTGN